VLSTEDVIGGDVARRSVTLSAEANNLQRQDTGRFFPLLAPNGIVLSALLSTTWETPDA
jgi:hypothetical protein